MIRGNLFGPRALSLHAAGFAVVVCAALAPAQTAQVGADANAANLRKLAIDYVGYRPARYETEHVIELDNSNPNEGGFISVYLRNNSDKPIRLRFWRLNGKDESHYRVDLRDVWDRTYHDTLEPGQSTVCEINGLTRDFAAGQPFNFAYVDSSWMGAGYILTKLTEDPVQIACIRFLPGLQEIEVFFRHMGEGSVEFASIEAVGKASASVAWAAQRIDGTGLTIARLKLAAPVAPSDLVIIRAAIKDSAGEHAVFSHRRAFEDRFPIGTWGMDDDLRDQLHSLYIDTGVQGGKKADSFFATDAARLGMRAMVHTGVITNVDQVRELGDSPHVACWMIQDEPDWSIPATQMLLAEQTVRRYNSTIPTFVTLCRNVKFFEYAQIPDIPCMDHYAVTAPSSSKWPFPWGTRLEETAYYTRDLKAASEPKPIWVWTQGLFDWDQRPKRPVPTVSELSAQLVLNLARGAKGIIWFSYRDKLGEKYPEVREAMRGWGRAMSFLREDLLASEPAPWPIAAPEKVDAALLTGRDAAVLCLTNLDYQIDAEAYPFSEKKDLAITVPLPSWLTPAGALRVDHTGIAPLEAVPGDGGITVKLPALLDTTLVLLPNDPARLQGASAAWAALDRAK